MISFGASTPPRLPSRSSSPFRSGNLVNEGRKEFTADPANVATKKAEIDKDLNTGNRRGKSHVVGENSSKVRNLNAREKARLKVLSRKEEASKKASEAAKEARETLKAAKERNASQETLTKLGQNARDKTAESIRLLQEKNDFAEKRVTVS